MPAVRPNLTFLMTRMSTYQKGAQARVQKDSRPPHAHLVVAVLVLLPQRARERFCYVLLAVALILAVVGMCHAPLATAAGTTGIGFLSWLARVFGR